MKKTITLMLAMVMLLTIATSCGSSSGDVATTTTTAQATSNSCISIAQSDTPVLDPAVGTSGSSLMSIANLYDTLTYPGEDGLELRVAESYESSDDGLTYTFTIKEGILFHNGMEMKASDVAFSMNRLLTIGESYAYIFSAVDSAAAVDDYTVEFYLNKTSGTLPSALIRLQILCEEQVMDNLSDGPYGEYGDYGKDYLVYNDAGSGAYQTVELVQQDYFLAERFDDWFVGFDHDYAAEQFKIVYVSEAATIKTMMANKDLDMTDQWQTNESLSALEAIDGVSLGLFSSGLLQSINMNTQMAPTDCIYFRRAIACLVDYATACESIFIGSIPSNGLAVTSVAGFAETTIYDYNLEQAKEYLAASKYADTYGDYTLEFLANSDSLNTEKLALLLQSAAAQVGITIEINLAPWVSLIDRVGSVDTTPQLITFNAAPAYADVGSFLEARYHSKNVGTWEQSEWLCNDTIDAMIEDAMSTVDQDERFAQYEVIQNYIVDEYCPSVYVCDYTERCAYQSGYITWPLVEDGIGASTWGYTHIIADMELHLDQK